MGISYVLFLPTTPGEEVLHSCHDFWLSFLKDEASITIRVVVFVRGNPAGGVISSTGWFTQMHGSLTWLLDVKQCCITGRDLTVLCWVYLSAGSCTDGAFALNVTVVYREVWLVKHNCH